MIASGAARPGRGAGASWRLELRVGSQGNHHAGCGTQRGLEQCLDEAIRERLTALLAARLHRWTGRHPGMAQTQQGSTWPGEPDTAHPRHVSQPRLAALAYTAAVRPAERLFSCPPRGCSTVFCHPEGCSLPPHTPCVCADFAPPSLRVTVFADSLRAAAARRPGRPQATRVQCDSYGAATGSTSTARRRPAAANSGPLQKGACRLGWAGAAKLR